MAYKFEFKNRRGGIGNLFAGLNPLIWFDGDSFPLAAAVLTSAWVRCDEYARIVGAAFASHAGTLKVQFSTTGIADQVDAESADIVVPAGAQGVAVSVETQAEYCRLVFTNGGTNLTAMRCKVFGRASS